MSRKLGINPRSNPKPYTTYKDSSFIKDIGMVKEIMVGAFGAGVIQFQSPLDFQLIVFTVATGRQWLDGLVKIWKEDQKRKHKWLSDRPAIIGEWMWKELKSPFDGIKIKVRAQVDDTLPPESDMSKMELRVIYGR